MNGVLLRTETPQKKAFTKVRDYTTGETGDTASDVTLTVEF